MEYLNLFQNCILVKGYMHSVICDLQLRKYHHIPNDMYDILIFLENNSIEKCFSYYGEENHSILKEYIEFIIEENLGIIYHSQLKELIPLKMYWDSFSAITNMIIEFNSEINYQNDFIDAVTRKNLQGVEIRIYNEFNQKIERLIQLFEDSTVQSINLVIPYAPDIENELNKLVKRYVRIQQIIVHSSPKDKYNRIFNGTVPVLYIRRDVNSCLACGIIKTHYFATNVTNFTESKNFNSCLNRKIAIDYEGNIRNCPSMPESFGNIKNTTL